MKTTRANKKYNCQKCGCNIEKGQMHKASKVYVPVKHDCEFETKSGGKTEIFREHTNSISCQLAINKVQDEFINPIPTITV